MTARSAAGWGARFAVLGLGLVELAGCTQLLGIDGEYGLSVDGDGGSVGKVLGAGGALGDGGAPGLERDSGGGLAPRESGGSSSNGGSEAMSAGGTGAAPVVAASTGGSGGCASCAPPPVGPCAPGAYEGAQLGQHAPTITVLGVNFDVKGVVKFRLATADGGVSSIVDGAVDGTLQVIGTPPFSATLTGTVDCETGQLAGVIDGKFWLTSNVSAPPASSFHGIYSGVFASGKFNGTWNEEEPNAPTMPVGTETGRGKGSWESTRTGP